MDARVELLTHIYIKYINKAKIVTKDMDSLQVIDFRLVYYY